MYKLYLLLVKFMILSKIINYIRRRYSITLSLWVNKYVLCQIKNTWTYENPNPNENKSKQQITTVNILCSWNVRYIFPTKNSLHLLVFPVSRLTFFHFCRRRGARLRSYIKNLNLPCNLHRLRQSRSVADKNVDAWAQTRVRLHFKSSCRHTM